MELVRRLLAETDLTADAEQALARLAREGDRDARERLVRCSLRLVALRVRALGFGPRDVDDAFQVGVLALLAAVDRFDPDRGVRLATFAWPWLTHALHAHRAHRQEVPTAEPPERVPPSPAGSSLDLEELLSDLPAGEREVLRHRFSRTADGTCPTPWDDVALHLGTSPATARRRADRALSRLRREVGRVTDRAPSVEPAFPRSSIGRAFDC